MDCLEVTLMWSLLMRIALILLFEMLKNNKKNNEEVIFQTRDSKAISKAVSKEESSL